MNLKRIIFLLLLLLLLFSFFQKERLPSNFDVDDRLYQDPIQTKVDKDVFQIEKNRIVYKIEPLYEYELYGMIVSYHHSDSLFDYYHMKWSDFLNVKDICVIWGDNIKEKVYESLEFKNGSWTCYVEGSRKDLNQLKENELSNNHLLSDKKEVSDSIIRSGIGDQIYLKGYLVKYSIIDGNFSRGTSVTRDDKKGGACETIYVTDFIILDRANYYWHLIFSISKYSIIAYLILYIIFLFYKLVRRYHFKYKHSNL